MPLGGLQLDSVRILGANAAGAIGATFTTIKPAVAARACLGPFALWNAAYRANNLLPGSALLARRLFSFHRHPSFEPTSCQ